MDNITELKQDSNPPLLSPIGDKILCRECEDAGDLQSKHLIIPDMAKSPSRLYQVLRLGTERPWDELMKVERPWPVQIGEQILLPQYCGTDIKIDGHPCKIVRTDDILGVYR